MLTQAKTVKRRATTAVTMPFLKTGMKAFVMNGDAVVLESASRCMAAASSWLSGSSLAGQGAGDTGRSLVPQHLGTCGLFCFALNLPLKRFRQQQHRSMLRSYMCHTAKVQGVRVITKK
mmetsp:Transcript_87149/g.156961  ORF Transcript_87149/g.156961 Transcript_87149/m.156961 type:complete len:119 (+) Transcript_87149:380-736(+)